MKKIVLISLIGLLTFSCTEDFLDKNKIGEQTTETFFQTDDHAIKAVNACYSHLWDYRYVSANFAFGNVIADDAVKGSEPGDMPAIADMENWNLNANNMMMGWKYPHIWRGILKCNQVIDNLDGVERPEMDEQLKARVVAEAKFLRAYYYFDMVRTFGGMPVIDKPLQLDELDMDRASAKEVYDFIISDLIAAEADLFLKSQYPDSEMGRATKGAAQAMLVKAYAYMASPGYSNMDFYDAQGWVEAKTWAEKLFSSGEYSLYQGYFGDIFSLEGENGPESIFEIQFTDTGVDDTFTSNGNFTTVFTMPRGPWGWGLQQPTYDLYAAYEEGDTRREATIISSEAVILNEIEHGAPESTNIIDDRTGLHSLKNYLWPDERPTFWRNSPVNERIMRLSDIYLLYAEACFHTGEESTARDYVNLVRARARGGNTEVLPDVEVSGQPLLEAIYNERRTELAMENHRFWDLNRWGLMEQEVKTQGYKVKASTTIIYGEDDEGNEIIVGYEIEDAGEPLFKAGNYNRAVHIVFPIPQNEIDISGWSDQQNSGY